MHYAKMLKVSPPPHPPPKKILFISHARNIMQQTLVFYVSIFQMCLHRFEFWVEHRQFVLEKFKQAVKLW